jgi:hypothetical protein
MGISTRESDLRGGILPEKVENGSRSYLHKRTRCGIRGFTFFLVWEVFFLGVELACEIFQSPTTQSGVHRLNRFVSCTTHSHELGWKHLKVVQGSSNESISIILCWIRIMFPLKADQKLELYAKGELGPTVIRPTVCPLQETTTRSDFRAGFGVDFRFDFRLNFMTDLRDALRLRLRAQLGGGA